MTALRGDVRIMGGSWSGRGSPFSPREPRRGWPAPSSAAEEDGRRASALPSSAGMRRGTAPVGEATGDARDHRR